MSYLSNNYKIKTVCGRWQISGRCVVSIVVRPEPGVPRNVPGPVVGAVECVTSGALTAASPEPRRAHQVGLFTSARHVTAATAPRPCGRCTPGHVLTSVIQLALSTARLCRRCRQRRRREPHAASRRHGRRHEAAGRLQERRGWVPSCTRRTPVLSRTLRHSPGGSRPSTANLTVWPWVALLGARRRQLTPTLNFLNCWCYYLLLAWHDNVTLYVLLTTITLPVFKHVVIIFLNIFLLILI